MRLRKTLPADIEQIIASRGRRRPWLEAVARCEVGAYLAGSAYEPRLMHFPASEEITDFLLARGEDINSRDRYERTPIHARVSSRCLDQIPMLIARGGDINARDTSDQTALFGVVERFSVADVSRMIGGRGSAGLSPTRGSTGRRRLSRAWWPGTTSWTRRARSR